MFAFKMGFLLGRHDQFAAAAEAFRKAIELQPDFAEAHCHLGQSLRGQGEFKSALEALRQGHVLGARRPNWSFPSEEWIRETERMVAAEEKLPAIDRGEVTLKDNRERLGFAQLCLLKKMPSTAMRLYKEVFAAEPLLASDLQHRHRYNAACAAARAARGDGEAETLDDAERLHLRRQALDWLKAELSSWTAFLTDHPEKARAEVVPNLRHWQKDPDFSGLRDPGALANLPAAERAAWRQLWIDLDTLRRRADGEPKQP